MKKKTIMGIAALIIAAIVSVTVASCKKDKEEALAKAVSYDAQALLSKIEAFQTLRKTVNSGAKTDGTMTINEMRDVIDLTSNFEHSQHEIYCVNTILDTIHVAMPILDGEGNVSEISVVSAYNAFETELENLMLTIDDGMDIPSYFSIILPEDTEDQDIDIVFVRGEQDDKHTSAGPFVEGDNYKWGLGLGHCPVDSTARITDAAMELSRKFKYQPDPQHQGLSHPFMVEHVTYTPMDCTCANEPELEESVFYVDLNMEDCADFWLYKQSGEFEEEPCIDYDELNCYWRSIRRNIVLSNAPLHYAPKNHSPYNECSIKGYWLFGPNQNKRSERIHAAHVTYCYIFWAQDPISGE